MICVPSEFCRLLASCSKLEELCLTDVVLASSQPLAPVPEFTVFDMLMTAIRDRSSSANAVPMAIYLSEVGLQGHWGSVNTDEVEITEMLETHGPGSMPLRNRFEHIHVQTFEEIRAAFPCSDSEDEEDNHMFQG